MSEELQSRLHVSLDADTQMKSIMKQLKEGNMRKFFVQDELLFYGDCLYTFNSLGLRRYLLKECHEYPWSGHLGQCRTLELLERGYRWENMREDVEEYVQTCIIYQ